MNPVRNFSKQNSKADISSGVKAVALVSGGLDSVLAVKIISDQGINVIGFHFLNHFNASDPGRIKKLGKTLNVEIKMLDIGQEFLKILRTPKYGYGKNLNPCIDCRILGLKKAHEFMKEIGAKFIITGEVLGQRPMSQNKGAIGLIEKESGLEGLIVRPLSARRLPMSIPEKEGWIKRDELLDIEGRSRKRQLALAKKYNISGYSSPAGGCLLTDPGFSLRAKDLLDSGMLDIHSINLVKTGRYFRISDSFKLIVGRNHEENEKLMKLAREGDIILEPESKGPTAIGLGKIDDGVIKTASKIVAYYCKPARSPSKQWRAGGGERVNVSIKVLPDEEMKSVIAEKIDEKKLLKYRV